MINHASFVYSWCTTSWFLKTYSKSKGNVYMLYGHIWGSLRVEKHFSSVKMKLKWKDNKEEVWYGFCLSQELSDNLLSCCFIQWDFADHVETACRQLIFYLGNVCLMALVSEVSFESNFVVCLLWFHFIWNMAEEELWMKTCLCTLLWTQKR